MRRGASNPPCNNPARPRFEATSILTRSVAGDAPDNVAILIPAGGCLYFALL
jgi:hypothetical protein